MRMTKVRRSRFVWTQGQVKRLNVRPSVVLSQVMREIAQTMPLTVDPYSVGRRAGLSLALGLLANIYLLFLKTEKSEMDV